MTMAVITTGWLVSPGGKDALVAKALTVGEERRRSTRHHLMQDTRRRRRNVGSSRGFDRLGLGLGFCLIKKSIRLLKFQEVANELSHSQTNVSLREPIGGLHVKSGDFGATAGGQEVRWSFSTESRDEPKPPLQKK